MDKHTPVRLMLITGSPEVAAEAEAAGVDRILVDLEVLGKKERQGHHDTWISGHALEDVGRVSKALKKSEMIVRVNPVNAGTEEEVSAVLAQGAKTLMLPMFRTVDELKTLLDLVGDRAAVMPLVETPEAAERIGDVARTPGVSEVYVGLNDLHLALKMDFMFEPLADGMVDKMAAEILAAGKPFGFGGIARVGEGQLPGELVLAEHVRLGSSCVILSRTFHRNARTIEDLRRDSNLKFEVEKLRSAERDLWNRSEADVRLDRRKVEQIVRMVAEDFRARKEGR